MLARKPPPCAMCKWLDKYGSKPVGTWGAYNFCPCDPKCRPDNLTSDSLRDEAPAPDSLSTTQDEQIQHLTAEKENGDG